MTGKAKRNALLLLGLVLLMTMIIAASLPQLELKPGMPLPKVENNQVVVVPVEAEPLVAISVYEFFKIIFLLFVAGAFLFAFYKLLRGADWKSLTSLLRPALMIILVVSAFIFLIMLLPAGKITPPVVMLQPTMSPPATAPLGKVPALLFWLVGFALLATGILICYWILRPPARVPTTLDLVGLEAEKAWQSLLTGLDLKDVIIRCYRQMSLALEKERGLERKDSMTTREFEQLIESAGIPHTPIHQLTLLFEAVRYGAWQPNPQDERSAIQCLEAIMLSARQAQETV